MQDRKQKRQKAKQALLMWVIQKLRQSLPCSHHIELNNLKIILYSPILQENDSLYKNQYTANTGLYSTILCLNP